ncbi:MAG: DUF2436 domain-containing protein, partial [Bacteroidales bacterium]|nr:DUF2436 domain-containing protein [Bacteroidales bacterium]
MKKLLLFSMALFFLIGTGYAQRSLPPIAKDQTERLHQDTGTKSSDPMQANQLAESKIPYYLQRGNESPPSRTPTSLSVTYNMTCDEALLTWDSPARGRAVAPLAGNNSSSEKYIVTMVDGEKVLTKPEQATGLTTSRTATGQAAMRNSAPRASAPTPPRASRGMVNVTLEAHDVWGDGSGFQLLLDETATQFGLGIPATSPLTTSCSGIPATLYDIFSHKIPTAANPACTSTNIVFDGFVTIQIPAGTYDWCIANPCPGDRIWIVGSSGPTGTEGRRDNYVFEDGYDYHFELFLVNGGMDGDAVQITTTLAGDPCDAITGLTINVTDNDVELNWTAPGSAPDHYEVLRNGTSMGTLTATSYTELSVPSGEYTYCVKAMYAGTCIPQSVCTAPTMVGDMCYITIAMQDDWGDGWNGAQITVMAGGTTYGVATLSGGAAGTATILVPS